MLWLVSVCRSTAYRKSIYYSRRWSKQKVRRVQLLVYPGLAGPACKGGGQVLAAVLSYPYRNTSRV
jgi:hypothetical protein